MAGSSVNEYLILMLPFSSLLVVWIDTAIFEVFKLMYVIPVVPVISEEISVGD